MTAEEIKPYNTEGAKSEQVEQMFDSIAPAYDFMNGAMTFGMHRRWRNKMLEMAAAKTVNPEKIIDLATGTGDVAIALARKFPEAEIFGVDLSAKMLAKAKQKIVDLKDNIRNRIEFSQGDCLNLPFPDESFNLATIAYGVRNFENLMDGFAEMHRILKPGGTVMILELSRPEQPVIRACYDLYARHLIPVAGRLASKDCRAYTYLPESIKAMPPRAEICEMLKRAGFDYADFKSLTLGVVTIYTAVKP